MVKRLVLPVLEDKFRAVLPRPLILSNGGEEGVLSFSIAIQAKSFDELFVIPGAVFSTVNALSRSWTLEELKAALLSELRAELPWALRRSATRENHFTVIRDEEVTSALKRTHERWLRKLQKSRSRKPAYLSFIYHGAEGPTFRVGLFHKLKDHSLLLLTEEGYRTFLLSRTFIQMAASYSPNSFRELIFTLTAVADELTVAVTLRDLSN